MFFVATVIFVKVEITGEIFSLRFWSIRNKNNWFIVLDIVANDTGKMVGSLYHTRKYLTPFSWFIFTRVSTNLKWNIAVISEQELLNSLSSPDRIQNHLYGIVAVDFFSTRICYATSKMSNQRYFFCIPNYEKNFKQTAFLKISATVWCFDASLNTKPIIWTFWN